MNASVKEQHTKSNESASEGFGLIELAVILKSKWKVLAAGPALVGAIAYGIAVFIPPTYIAQTTFLPPQQQQSSAASAIASLGALAGIAGAAGVKTPADQYLALMQSNTVADRIIERFNLMEIYGKTLKIDARKKLAQNVHLEISKKDGLMWVSVEDEDAKRSAAIANAYVEELRSFSSTLAVTEAQQRRVFFEKQLNETKSKLAAAQQALAASGFSEGALRSEPKSAAESYARLQAEATAAEVRLQTLRGSYSEGAPELRAAQERLGALKDQLVKAEKVRKPGDESDYVGKYREFKYQETLFELFARQYELARVDESREGALIQVVDTATPPERRSKPKRTAIAAAAWLAAFFAMSLWLVIKYTGKMAPISSDRLRRLEALKASLT
ncbi:MAG: lipopolysaccharide biosynthesis protein [Chloroflexi bacterium]|nr:lipopolysaccharide biosynthesis protein [Chloroflexota bacterium]|tara:strand:- start:11984 stop:13144 length:1161 start_codon:yes stop_codon:yes gene_type:complete